MKNSQTIANYWDSRELNFNKTKRLYWYQHPQVLEFYRNLVVKSSLPVKKKPINCYIYENYPGVKFQNAVSIGCGSGHKELDLVADGLVESFSLFELSSQVIAAGKKRAIELGLSDRVSFSQRDVLDGENVDLWDRFDLVHWDNSLHHMFSVEQAINLSVKMLAPGGLLVIDDYVGPSYMQVPDEWYIFADEIRGLLPDKYLKNNTYDRGRFPVIPKSPRIPVQRFLDTDPSEMVDSDNILPQITKICKGAKIIKTGGILFFLGLRPLFANFSQTSVEDQECLARLLKLDQWYTQQTGNTFHAFISWEKPLTASDYT